MGQTVETTRASAACPYGGMASAAFQRSEEHLRVEWKGVRSSGLKPHWRACTPSDEICSHPYDGIITQVSSSAAALYVPRDPHTEARAPEVRT